MNRVKTRVIIAQTVTAIEAQLAAKSAISDAIQEASNLMGTQRSLVRISTPMVFGIEACRHYEAGFGYYDIEHPYLCLREFKMLRPSLKLSNKNIAAILFTLALAWTIPKRTIHVITALDCL